MNILIWYPKCSTCINAKKYLEERNIRFILRNIKDETPNIKELDNLIKLSNKDIKTFFNTSGLAYKKLNLKEKLPNMSYNEKLDLLVSDAMLIKRPIFIYNDKVLIGFKKDIWDILIK